jgi:hypothetical membrane protein
MQKVLLLLLSFFASLKSFSQDHLPTIKANSTSVDIRVDDDYFVKGGWILDSTKKPDVFSIGSKWLYTTKKVTFITAIDSISADIHPNSTFNFIILLHEKTTCYIQIATMPNPIFMQPKIVIPLVSGFIIFLLLLYIFKSRLNDTTLLSFGYIAPLLFLVITFLSGFIHGNYHHFKNVISELGALGTKSELFTSAALMILAVCCILFSTGFYRASRRFKLSSVPAILSFSMPLTMIWAGIFPLGNEFHSMTGPLPLLLIAGFLLAYLLWKNNPSFTAVSKVSLLCFFISALILLRFIQPFGYLYEGLIQRFFYFAWTIWSISIAYHFSKKENALLL